MFGNNYSYSNGGFTTINLSNSSNNFNSSPIQVNAYTQLETAPENLYGVSSFNFNGGSLSVPSGGTLSIPMNIYSGGASGYAGNGIIYGGTSASSPLILTGQFTGIKASYNSEGPGALYLYNYVEINPSSGSGMGGTGNVIVVGNTSISQASAFGSNYVSLAGGTLQFLEDMTFGSLISLDNWKSGILNVSGNTIDLTSQVVATSASTLYIEDSVGGGTLNLNPSGGIGDFSSYITIVLESGSLSTNITSGGSFPISLTLAGGTLNAENVYYTGTVTAQSNTTSTWNIESAAPQIGNSSSGSLTGSGTLNVSGSGSLTINRAIDFAGTLNLGNSGTGYSTAINPLSFGGGAGIPTINVYNSSVLAAISYQGSGGNLDLYTIINGYEEYGGISFVDFGADAVVFLNGNITGSLIIDGIPSLNTQNYTVSGVVTTGDVSLGDSTSGMTLLADTTTSQFSQIQGAITGEGFVVIEGSTIFGSPSSPTTNTFSGGLTLTSGSLEVYSSASLGSGTLIGNGGELISEQSSNMDITNKWVFNTGTTTSFNGFDGITLKGNIATGGSSGIVGIELSDGSLTINTPLLTLNEGTSFQTNGNSLTVSNLSGTGGLILGYKRGITSITDTLTISGTEAVTYSGVISDNPIGGDGAVEILAPVTFTGDNTFTGGLTLSSNSDTTNTSMLTISAANALGLGNIYGDGGGLATAATSDIQIITVTNDWVFTVGTTTTFDVISAETTLDLTGTLSGSSTTGTAYITKEGSGILYIGTDASFTEGDTYELTIAQGNVTVDASPTTTALYFFDEGVLYGDTKDYFALADAFYGTWDVRAVTLAPPVVNVVIQGEEKAYPSLRGNGVVTNVEVYEGGIVAPGASYQIGALEVTDSIIFYPRTYLGIAINADSGSILIVGNEVNLDSSVYLTVAPESGPYLRTNHVILTAGLLEGKFDGFLIPNSFFLDGFLDYSVPNQVILSIEPHRTADLATGTNAIAVSKSLDKVILWNREHVSYQFTSTPNPSSLHPFLEPSTPPLLEDVFASLLPLTTEEEMTDALNQLQPAFLKGFTIVQEDNIVKMQDTLSNRMEYILNTQGCFTFAEDKGCCGKDEKIFHGWVSGLGDVLAQDSNTYADSPQVGYQSKMGGFAVGIDGHFAKVLYLGGIGGYTTSYVNWKQNQGTGNINTGYAGVYLSAVSEMFYGNVSLIGGFSNFSSKRNIQYTGVDLTASGRHAGKQLLSHVDTGFNWTLGGGYDQAV